MNCVRLYIISFFTILAAACSEQAAPDAPQGVKGLWRLSSVSHFNGFLENYRAAVTDLSDKMNRSACDLYTLFQCFFVDFQSVITLSAE